MGRASLSKGRTPEQEQAFTETLIQSGGDIKQATLAAGYAESVAKRGRADLSPKLRTVIDIWQNADALLATADKIEKPGVAERIIKGRLADAILNADDAVAVQAAHRLGTAKGIAMFTPDAAIGVAVYQVSPRLEQLAAQLAKDEPPILDVDMVTDSPTPTQSSSDSSESDK